MKMTKTGVIRRIINQDEMGLGASTPIDIQFRTKTGNRWKNWFADGKKMAECKQEG